MVENEKKVIFIIKSHGGDLDTLQLSITSLLKQNVRAENIIVALANTNINKSVKAYLTNQAIKSFNYKNDYDLYNQSFKNYEFDFISFIVEGDTFSENFYETLIKNISLAQNNIYIFPITSQSGTYPLSNTLKKSKNSEISIEATPEKIWLHINSVVFSKSLMNDFKYVIDDIEFYTEVNFLTKLVVLNGGYKIIKNIYILTQKSLENSTNSRLEEYNINWYMNFLVNANDFNKFSINKYGTILKYIQFVNMYLLKNLFNSNTNAKNKHIMDSKLYHRFLKKVSIFLDSIEDNIIFKTIGNKPVNFYLLKLKNENADKEVRYIDHRTDISILFGTQHLFSAKNTNLKILLTEFNHDRLDLIISFPFPLKDSQLKIYAKYLNKKIYAQNQDLYTSYKVFSEVIYDHNVYKISIPLREQKGKQYINFYAEYKNADVALNIKFDRPLSRLSNLKYAYFNCGKFSLNYRRNGILVMKRTFARTIKREFKFIVSLLNNKNKDAKKSAFLRILYHITKPFYRKEIWLFEDKIYKAGDNGEYLYTYASKQKDGIKKYYILKSGSTDSKRFNKEKKKFVKFGTLKHKLLFLNSSIVFETHNNVIKQHSFGEQIEKYFRDLYNSNNVCIQHGLSVQKMPDFLNRINDNLKQYFLATKVEKKNLLNKEYAYTGYEKSLKITGCPRYDGLKNNDKRQILITPTWRNYLALPSLEYGKSRGYNDNFKKLEYFKIYNSLINDKKLIRVAKECGYRIVYLLHPCTSSQIDDYDKNEFVELVAATDDLNYERILTESSLMVTDYSGVQFDFSYMYKPIVYFHPNELPPSYDEGEYKYETMALGEITKTTKETVNLICEYMQNNCNIKSKYKKRVDQFFEYHDFNNCRRIYEEIIKSRKEN